MTSEQPWVGKHKVALGVADRLCMTYEQALPLALRATRMLGEGASMLEYVEACRRWLSDD
jgi:hypothetical protein